MPNKHARAFAVKEDICLFNGDGTSTYGGIVGLRTAILGLAGAVDAASGHDTFAEITATDLRGVMAALPDIPGITPEWYTSKPGQNLMFGRLTDAAGGNTKRHLSEMMPEQYGGYDISTSPAMPKVATDLSDVAMALFGDLRMGVVMGDRRGMTLMVDPYSLSLVPANEDHQFRAVRPELSRSRRRIDRRPGCRPDRRVSNSQTDGGAGKLLA